MRLTLWNYADMLWEMVPEKVFQKPMCISEHPVLNTVISAETITRADLRAVPLTLVAVAIRHLLVQDP